MSPELRHLNWGDGRDCRPTVFKFSDDTIDNFGQKLSTPLLPGIVGSSRRKSSAFRESWGVYSLLEVVVTSACFLFTSMWGSSLELIVRYTGSAVFLFIGHSAVDSPPERGLYEFLWICLGITVASWLLYFCLGWIDITSPAEEVSKKLSFVSGTKVSDADIEKQRLLG